MTHRVRAAGILIEDGRVLLVSEGTMPDGQPYFIPPGGGLEPFDASLAACVEREFWEEAGLRVTAGELVYLREFLDLPTQVLQIEVFFRVRRQPGEHEINPHVEARSTRWFGQNELSKVIAFPQELKSDLWRTDGGSISRYLGRSEG